MAGLLLTVTACEKEGPDNRDLREVQFNATLEALQNDASGAKVYLENEEWIYWELGDEISVGSNLTTAAPHAVGTLVNATPGSDYEDFNGVFVAPLPVDSKYFLGMHPCNPKNVIIGSGSSSDANFTNPAIDLCKTQPRRPGDKADITFARQVFPLVAWYGGEWSDRPYNLDFHALGGIMRIDLFNSTASTASINSIVFHTLADSPCQQLCGPFFVRNYKTNFPYLESPASYDDSCHYLTLTFGSEGLSFSPDALKSFYVVLPATSGTGISKYHLEMTVNATVGGVAKSFTKNLSVSTRRNGITHMNALGVTDWNDASTINYGLVGHGTQARPFKVYTVDDLLYLRSCYNSVERKINGQPITEDTYIALMRSDIVLTTANWHSSSITNFVGHLSDASHAPSHPGITNNSEIPIFQDIASTGHVVGITVKSNSSIIASSTEGVSPFCNINRGEMRNCRIDNDITGVPMMSSSYSDLCGIAVQNLAGGVIIGCECKANMTCASTHVAGICLHNSGTISESYVTASLTMSAPVVAGICYDNRGIVEDCYFSASIVSSTSDWGGIVFSNGTGGQVRHCYNSGSITTTGTLGGIVHSVSNGTVNYCWLVGTLQAPQVGGIVHNISGGKIINSYVNNAYASIVSTASGGTRLAGGMAAVVSGGSVENSYVHNISITGFGATLGGFVASLTGGTVRNCYSYESYTNHLYGSTTLSGSALDNALGVGTDPCYLVNGSQTGVTYVSPSASGLSGLLSSLNSHVPSGGVNWEDTPPILQAYIP